MHLGLRMNIRIKTISNLMVCCSLLMSSCLCSVADGAPASSHTGEDERILHLLNRFTFGPRPTDVAKVRAEGMQRWFEEQLNPSSINDKRLDERLAQFPAMRMKQSDMVRRYPASELAKHIAYRDMKPGMPGIPHGSDERAIYLAQANYYLLLRDAKQRSSSMQSTPAMQSAPRSGMEGDAENSQSQMFAVDEEDANARKFDAFIQPMPEKMAAAVLALSAEERYHRILSMKPVELFSFLKAVHFSVRATTRDQQLMDGMSPLQKETLYALLGSRLMLSHELTQSRLIRDIYSDRQLEAVMTDFWLNHFNVYIKKNTEEVFYLPEYERQIRKHALGKFEDLLNVTATSPAMLLYLDNYISVGPHSHKGKVAKREKKKNSGLNENYARELMELHTLGVDGGYTQHDVTDVAKVFTGWTVEEPLYGNGRFTFKSENHEPRPKLVLGRVIKESGEAEGYTVLHMLATSPATARFISRKLAIRFVSDNPPQSLIDKMAKSFLDSDGDIKTVLRTLFASEEFWSPAIYHSKMKTPLEYVVSAARVSHAEVHDGAALTQSLSKLGMPLYGAKPPTGYHWNEQTWLNSTALVSRMNFAVLLATNRLPGTEIDWNSMRQHLGIAADGAAKEIEQTLEIRLLGSAASDRTRGTVLSQDSEAKGNDAAQMFNQSGKDEEDAVQVSKRSSLGAENVRIAGMAGLLLGSPEFQRR